jgi:opacity protein-like surface antigen
MFNNSKRAIMIAVAALALASPAFAQEADHTGSQLPHYFASNGSEIFGSWGPAVAVTSPRSVAPRSGSSAFAMVPRDPPAGGSFDPGATGGGSAGYNWMVQHDY